MLVLEGEQGILKSTACRILGGEWFSDSLPDISAGKETIAASARQMADRSGRDARHDQGRGVAAEVFITRTDERFRPPYGRAGGDRAAAMRLRRHHQQGRLPARRDRRPTLLAGQDDHASTSRR